MPEKKSLFEIRDLKCGYYDRENALTKCVLKIGSLDIYKGEFVVLLGNSGSGKSTLLETLGLMANRIISGDVRMKPGNTGKSFAYFKDLWGFNETASGKNTEQNPDVTKIRREYFNFIFQENNLMYNLTNSENIIIADLINDSKTRDRSYHDTKNELKLVNLDRKSVV